MIRKFLNLTTRSADFAHDAGGASAVEFAVILPVMLLMFFGTVTVSSGVAVDRKVTLVARTLSDLVSQASVITDSDFSNCFAASTSIMTPYSPTPVKAKISEVKIDANSKATIVWSKASNDTARGVGSVVTGTVPAALLVPNTYLIWSEVSYDYKPAIGYDGASGYAAPTFPLGESFYTRPRQSACVLYNTASCP
jgi:Flp pilus assembly protein TadG